MAGVIVYESTSGSSSLVCSGVPGGLRAVAAESGAFEVAGAARGAAATLGAAGADGAVALSPTLFGAFTDPAVRGVAVACPDDDCAFTDEYVVEVVETEPGEPP